jgi:hypothetical protein
MEVLIEAEVVTEKELSSLLKEANEILKTTSASGKTVSK